MRLSENTSEKDLPLGYTLKNDMKNVTLKVSALKDHKMDGLEKTDESLGNAALQVPEVSGMSEDQGLKPVVNVLDTQTGLPQVICQKRRRRRTTPQELVILEEEYLKDEKPNLLNRERIAAKINSVVMNEDRMGSREIQIWFQNKRQAMRRQSSGIFNTRTGGVCASQIVKQPIQGRGDDIRFQKHIQHKISSFKRIPSLRLCTNEGGKAQVMFNVLRENKNTHSLYKRDEKCENKRMSYFVGKENIPPDDCKKTKTEACEDEIEACARSLVGLARGW